MVKIWSPPDDNGNDNDDDDDDDDNDNDWACPDCALQPFSGVCNKLIVPFWRTFEQILGYTCSIYITRLSTLKLNNMALDNVLPISQN